MPVAAGMGCSYNPYKWMEHLNPDAGMLRLVAGLGTRAVERTPGDYPRLVGLDRAQANMRTTVAERHKFSQRQVDVLDLEQGMHSTISLDKIIELLPSWQKKMVLSHDTEAEYLLAQRGRYRKIYFSDCQGLVDNNAFNTYDAQSAENVGEGVRTTGRCGICPVKPAKGGMEGKPISVQTSAGVCVRTNTDTRGNGEGVFI